jgi:hypothetical protein
MGLWGVLLGGILAIVSGATVQILQNRLTSKRERDRWLFDNKKAEYRELLAALTKAQLLMSSVWSRSEIPAVIEPKEIDAAIDARNDLWIMLEDRIFIAEVAKKKLFVREWERILHIFEARGNFIEFVDHCARLRESILNAALSDFGLTDGN